MSQKDIKIHKADKTLQTKIGTGEVNSGLIEQCEVIMRSNEVDFLPLARKLIQKLETVFVRIETDGIGSDVASLVEDLTTPIMELKANSALFKYDLASHIANILLVFLERVQTLDPAIIQIAQAHKNALNYVFENKIQGDGGAIGSKMINELQAVCDRYDARNNG